MDSHSPTTSEGLAAELERLARIRDQAGQELNYDAEEAAEGDIAREVCDNLPTILAALNTRATPPVDTARDELRDMLAAAYTAGAKDVHMHLSGKEVEREADFAEAAGDYADYALNEGGSNVARG